MMQSGEAGPMREAADWLEKYRDFWEKSYQRLDALLEILQTPLNTDKLRGDLQLTSQQWFFFQDALDQKEQDAMTRATNVASTSERILEMMEEVVSGYEAQR